MNQSPNQPITQSPVKGLAAIIMAAGLGKRMKSDLAKVLHKVAGRPMIHYVVDLAERLAAHGLVVVVGHQADAVRNALEGRPVPARGPRLVVVPQREQLGTGHAVLQARPVFHTRGKSPASQYLILNGDTPLLTENMVRVLLETHRTKGATVTLLSALVDDPTGYGRIVRASEGEGGQGGSAGIVQRIVEDRDASSAERRIREINTGTYVVDGAFLFEALDQIKPQNAQGEYYLTDIVGVAADQGKTIAVSTLHDSAEGAGINSRVQLAEAEEEIRNRIRRRWMEDGVTIIAPATTWIDAQVTIGRDTILYPNVTLEGATSVGQRCVIRANTRITDCQIGDHVEIMDHCVLRDSTVEEETTIGPFAHMRPGVVVRRKAKVGNFVEMKKTELGEGSKANHLSYLGDTVIGKDVNIGAGTITCNYDGHKKHQTIIGDHVFIGSDTQLIAPVKVGAGAVIAAGTTVTRDVPPDALAIGRADQTNKPDWAARRRAMSDTERHEASGTRQTGGSPSSASRPMPLGSKSVKMSKRSKR
jgi:bifunctional UDP-N-acetylglucosamine pyrophosphorylase/glucosamine-1-phosphate N-acetyltransferase